jgi:hypothetical protein
VAVNMGWLNTYASEITLGLLVLQGLWFLIWFGTWLKLRAHKKMISRFRDQLEEGDRLRELLKGELSAETLSAFLRQLKENHRRMKGRMGLVRYNAIGERATDMSFSLALLDDEQNGVVISSLFSNQGQSYIYAKPVEKGSSTYRLSEEEQQAIKQAR